MKNGVKTLLAGFLCVVFTSQAGRASAEPIYISFLWHMHQPIYWPGEDVVSTARAQHYGFDVIRIHTDRSGPYTSWPSDAIGAARAAGLDRCGAQVSFSGSLMENLDAIEAAGLGLGGWKSAWRTASGWRTAAGNPAIDFVAFAFYHPLTALLDPDNLALQIRLHGKSLETRMPGYPVSRGFFPPETAFSERIISALKAEGVEWVLIDNIHFDRTLPDYPYTTSANLIPPNKADQTNTAGVSWVQLNGVWAPSKVSAPWGYQPHRARRVDPVTGAAAEIIVVPAARYEGNEDGRGGFGALNYEGVLSQLEPYNTDPGHPMLVVLHHDGDNYGGGSDSYYHGNFQSFVEWIRTNPGRFQCITIDDYLDLYPPARDDFIRVEDGSWSGADNGDPEFLKWNGDPTADGYSPDRHSWAVIAAAVNRVHTAASFASRASPAEVLSGSTAIGRAWRNLLNAETSCYWYWDRSEGGKWDSHPARAANKAFVEVDPMLSDGAPDGVPPTIYPPQREPYNPGEIEWGAEPMTEDLTVWTFVYDVSGLSRVELWYRFNDGEDDTLYGSSPWCVEGMEGNPMESRTDPRPLHIADLYSKTLRGLGGHTIDYFVEAEDSRGNIGRSEIRRVWIGSSGEAPGAEEHGVCATPTTAGGDVPARDGGFPALDAGESPDAGQKDDAGDAGAAADAGAEPDANIVTGDEMPRADESSSGTDGGGTFDGDAEIAGADGGGSAACDAGKEHGNFTGCACGTGGTRGRGEPQFAGLFMLLLVLLARFRRPRGRLPRSAAASFQKEAGPRPSR